jgi:ribose transport system permease protein
MTASQGPLFRFQKRFAAIWIALVILVVLCALVAPRSLLPATLAAVVPLAAFLAIASAGEAIVIMSRGIDLSIPAVVALSSTILLGFSGGRDDGMVGALVAALAFSAAVGLVNGLLVAILELNALIVTLAVGAVTSGATLWYREGLPAESRVPTALADWGGSRLLGLNVSAWVAIVLLAALAVVLRRSTIGRRFSAAGANPRAAWIAGINVRACQIAAFTVAGLLYGVVGILVSAFIRNPTLLVGDPYLLAPIAAAVLGGTAISGGIGSMVAVGIAALFLTQLIQVLKILGLSTAFQFVIFGVAIALGMAIAEVRKAQIVQFRNWLSQLAGSAKSAPGAQPR